MTLITTSVSCCYQLQSLLHHNTFNHADNHNYNPMDNHLEPRSAAEHIKEWPDVEQEKSSLFEFGSRVRVPVPCTSSPRSDGCNSGVSELMLAGISADLTNSETGELYLPISTTMSERGTYLVLMSSAGSSAY